MDRPPPARRLRRLPLTLLLLAAGLVPAAIALACEKVTEISVLRIHQATKGASLGSSAKVEGDVMVVGAPRHLGTGAVKTFIRDTQGRWRPATLLVPLLATNGAAVGRSLAFRDGTLIAGAPGDDSLGIETGSVYVTTRDEAGWTPVTRLLPADLPPFARFGEDLDLEGDLAVVAAPGFGAAFVFRRDGDVWSQETVLTSSTAGAGDTPAVCVAVHGETVLVGDPLGDAAHLNAGEVHVYRPAGVPENAMDPGMDGPAWSLASILTAGDGQPEARFGAAIAAHEDLAVVGAPGAAGTGAVYVFRFDPTSGSWGEEALLRPAGLKPGDQFGATVDARDDLVLVGAPRADGAGRVFLFRRLDTNWVLHQTLTAGRRQRGDRFGAIVATDGGAIVVGAPSAAGTGLGYAFSVPPLGDCDANGIPDTCDIARGELPDEDGDGVADNCGILTCADADINGDGLIDFEDMLRVILDWDTDGTDNDGDVNDDGVVGITDLNAVLAFWGECPGVCCLPVHVTCVELPLTACETQGGYFVGTNLECGTEFACPPEHGPPGACCLPDGGCLELPVELCDIIEGEFAGEESRCGDLVCP